MDHPLPKTPFRRKLIWAVPAALLSVVAAPYGIYRIASSGSSVVLPRATLTFGEVVEGPFQLSASFVATVESMRKLVLSSSVGGTVKSVSVSGGSRVAAGAMVVELSNPQIEMQLLTRESEVAQQVANLNSERLRDQQQTFEYTRQLSQARVELANAESLLVRNEELHANGMISVSAMERSARDVQLTRSQVDLLAKSLLQFETLSKQGLQEQRAAVEQLRRGLKVSRSVADLLEVRSPLDGVLMTLSVEKGQYLAPGGTIGTVGDDRELKLTAKLDEFYLNKIKPGQRGTAIVDGKAWPVEVFRVVASVTDRKFPIELKPLTSLEQIVLGQNAPVTLSLSDARSVLKLPVGSYLADGNGDWVFVVSPDFGGATRRQVKFGERNDREVTVLSGLSVKEKVLLSSYRDLMAYDRIEFK